MVVDLSRNSVACNSSVAVKCKETMERYPLMSQTFSQVSLARQCTGTDSHAIFEAPRA